MDSIELTGAIIERLRLYLPFVEVDNYPNSPADYRFVHPLGAVLVMYSGSEGDGNRRVRTFDLVVVSRVLLDACRLLEAIRWIMERWEPATGTGRFSCSHDSFMQEEEGVWWYGSRFELPGPPVHVREENLQSRIEALFNHP